MNICECGGVLWPVNNQPAGITADLRRYTVIVHEPGHGISAETVVLTSMKVEGSTLSTAEMHLSESFNLHSILFQTCAHLRLYWYAGTARYEQTDKLIL